MEPSIPARAPDGSIISLPVLAPKPPLPFFVAEPGDDTHPAFPELLGDLVVADALADHDTPILARFGCDFHFSVAYWASMTLDINIRENGPRSLRPEDSPIRAHLNVLNITIGHR